MRINNGTTPPRREPPPSREFSTSLKRLSTGLRINPSFGNTAGLVIAEGLRSAARRATQADQNARSFITAIRITESEAAIENAINKLVLSNTDQGVVIPQNIAALLETR
jgi:hypothetical protein